jgi:hypothetical protein
MPGLKRASIGWLSVLGVAASVGLGAPAAVATVVDRGTFAGSETGVADDLCGIAVRRDSTFSGSFRTRADRDGQAFFGHTNFEFRDVFRNPANGRSLTFEGHYLINELTATRISGNVYEFTVIEAGQPFTVRDASGRVVLRDSGVIRHRLLFDTLGDGTPGGVQLEDEIVAVGGPHPGLEQTEEEFCAMVHALIG